MDRLRCTARLLPGDDEAREAKRSIQRRCLEPRRERVLEATIRKRAGDYLGIERNVVAASGAVFLVGLGEELWKKFLPKYLESLGASVTAVGLFGTAEDFFDALYQYPGGWLADHWGRKRAFLAFLTTAATGYIVYLFSPSWPVLFIGLALTMAWQSMASPATFATIGDALPRAKRAKGFIVQSLLKRVPMVASPLIGGAVIGRLGLQSGIRVGLLITLAFAAITVPVLWTIDIHATSGKPLGISGVWNSFHSTLKRLLISDIVIRTCEGMADIFVILYAVNVIGVTIPQYGILVAIQLTTSILIYVPFVGIADKVGRKPFVILTFLCFAFFPVAVILAHCFQTLILAFMVGGLREIGEPSRKAMIVDLAENAVRARTVGLYYLVRSLSITPASVIGGLLWKVRPQSPFLVAGIVGIIGTVLFAATVEERHAS